MGKYRTLKEEEKEILRRNGIDTEGVVVKFRSEETIVLLRHKTRDQIIVRQGDRKWESND